MGPAGGFEGGLMEIVFNEFLDEQCQIASWPVSFDITGRWLLES
jgi:hypothetical protein